VGKRKPKRLGTFGRGRGVFVTSEMRRSEAWCVLTPSHRLVLIEMLDAFNRVSSFDSVDITKTGFTFTHAACQTDVDYGTFKDARKQICRVGFFREAPELKDLTPASPTVYVTSREWEQYEASPDEAQRLQRAAKSKERRIQSGRKRKNAFLKGLPELKNMGAQSGRHGVGNSGRYAKRQVSEIPADIEHKSVLCRGGNSGRSYDHHMPPASPASPPEPHSTSLESGADLNPPSVICPDTEDRETRKAAACEANRACVDFDVVRCASEAEADTRAKAKQVVELVDRALRVSGELWWRAWWADTLSRLVAKGDDLMDFEDAVTHAEDCVNPRIRQAKDLGQLRSPAGYLLSCATDLCKRRGVRWPDFPDHRRRAAVGDA